MESGGVIELVGVIERSSVFGDRRSGKQVNRRRSSGNPSNAKNALRVQQSAQGGESCGIPGFENREAGGNRRETGHPVIIEIWAEVETERRPRMTGKRLGEIAEAAFVAKAAELGFSVAKPWGDSDPYDFITQSGGKLSRVQVKSAHRRGKDGCYSFRAHNHALRSYQANEIDALVAHVVPENVWYVLPVKVVKTLRSLKLYPGSKRKRSKYEKYRGASEELRGR